MADIQHSSLTLDTSLHNPKGFAGAGNETLLSKSNTGVLEWVAKTTVGGPTVYGLLHMHGNSTVINGGSGVTALDTYYTVGSNGTTTPTLAHSDGGVAIASTNDGLVIPVNGDYLLFFTGSVVGDSGGTDKYVATVDFFRDTTAESHTARVFLDKTKEQNISLLGVATAVTNETIRVKSKVVTGDYDTGSAPSAQVWTDFVLLVMLMHKN